MGKPPCDRYRTAMLKYRLIFGPLMIAAALAIVWADEKLDTLQLTGFAQDLFLGRDYPPAGLVLLGVAIGIIIAGSRELATFAQGVGLQCHRWLVSAGAIAGCVAIYATPMVLNAPTGASIIATVLVAAFVGTLIWHSKDANTKGAIAAAGMTMFGIALLGLMPGFYLGIRRWHAAWVVVAILLITKSCDIGAYFTGRWFGKHKLIPWLSPKKTWEGLAGGIATSAAVAIGFAYLSQITDVTSVWRTVDGERVEVVVRYSMGWAAFAGVVFAIVGHAGDLMMSLLKRDAGVKDSGSSIPGFGGLLDVIDSPLLVAPFAFWLLAAAEQV